MHITGDCGPRCVFSSSNTDQRSSEAKAVGRGLMLSKIKLACGHLHCTQTFAKTIDIA